MSIEQSLERIASALERLAGNAPVPEIQVDAPTAKVGRPRKAAELAPAVEEDPLALAPAEKAVTTEEVRAALQAFMAKNGIEKTKALMIKHGANAAKPIITTIPEKNYAAVMVEIGS